MWFKGKGYFLTISFLCLIFPAVYSQDQKVADSLAIVYNNGVVNDSARLEILKKLSFNEVKDLNLSLKYAEELINLAIETENNIYLHSGYFQKGNKKRLFGDLEEALDSYFKSAEVASTSNNTRGEGNAYGAIADIYSISNNHHNARLYYNKAIAILRESNDSIALASAILNAGEEFMNSQIYDTAYVYFNESRIIFEKLNYLIGKAYSIGNIGMVYANTGESNLAEINIKEAIEILEELEDYYPICVYLISLANIYIEEGDEHAALNYAMKSLTIARQHGLKEQIRDANLKLSELYEQAGNSVESYNYFKNYIIYRDSINNIKTVQSMANLRTDFEVSQKQIEVDLLSHQKQNQRWWLITIAGILFTTFVVLYMSYRNNKNKQKANAQLKSQKEKVEKTLEQLKSTQSQLIQSEKMASLGELTAGIAHEIKNPLNFVNNFSEINTELLEEVKKERMKMKAESQKLKAEGSKRKAESSKLKAESSKLNVKGDEDLIDELLNDIQENEKKITHHGKRADAIVRGMLQHSRGSAGLKEPTDINALCDEYLRLAYHGMRAKDKSFNADFKTEFDETLPKINVVPQDIGRILLNLINNAFYATSSKSQTTSDYKPEVIVGTNLSLSSDGRDGGQAEVSPFGGGLKGEDYVQISVKDNGPGIPSEIKDKIFQPFFTTKPTGKGTGLGLSLSYDIVKAHGGELKVESVVGKGTEFIMMLPIN